MSVDRWNRLREQMKDRGWSAAAVLPGANLFYLSGLSFHLMGRPTVGLFPAEGRPRLIVPVLELEKARSAPLDFEFFDYGEDETSRAGAFQRGFEGLAPAGGRLAVEPLRMRFLELELIRSAAPGLRIEPAGDLLESFRIQKEASEIKFMRQAIGVAQVALEKTLGQVRMGMTEQELATRLTLELYQAGSDPELPFAPVVASGPASALPHAVPTDRALAAGDLLLFDWGAARGGYFSDLTRTFALGEIDPELAKVHAIVEQANAAGRKAVRPGVTCASVDAAARAVIDAAGYGPSFLHRTGHGLGLDVHEPPYLRGDNAQVLLPGMTFTVEPGVYLPGHGGVRIEDDMLVTETGGETLSDLPRALRRLG